MTAATTAAVPQATPLTLGATIRLFARLKLRLLSGNLRGEYLHKVGFVFSVVAAVIVAASGFFLLTALRALRPELAADIGVLAYSLIFFGWVLVPLFSFGLDDTLDPARLALLPLRTRQLAAGLFTSSVVGPWPLALLVVGAGLVAGLAGGAGGVLLGAVAVLLHFALCVVVSRLVTTGLSGVLRTRRGRDLLAVGVIGMVLLAQLPGLLLNRGGPIDGDTLLSGPAAVLRWTPPGMAAHAVADGGLAAAAELALLAVLVVLLGWAWIVVLRAAMVRPDASTQGARVRGSRGGVARFLPDGPLAAVVAKELKYARREPRGRASWLTVVLVTAVLAYSLGSQGAGSVARVLFPVCLGALVMGLQAGNTFGIDGRSLWMNSLVYGSPKELRTDLAGRHLAFMVIAVPLIAVLSAAVSIYAGDPLLGVAAAFTAWGALGVTLGVGAVTSVLFPYTVPERLNAFTGAAPGQGGIAFLGSVGGMMAGGVLLLPVALPMVFDLVWVGLLAVPYGAAVAWAGRRLAATIGFARFPELMAAVSRPT